MIRIYAPSLYIFDITLPTPSTSTRPVLSGFSSSASAPALKDKTLRIMEIAIFLRMVIPLKHRALGLRH
jgi:hypothetical protein